MYPFEHDARAYLSDLAAERAMSSAQLDELQRHELINGLRDLAARRERVDAKTRIAVRQLERRQKRAAEEAERRRSILLSTMFPGWVAKASQSISTKFFAARRGETLTVMGMANDGKIRVRNSRGEVALMPYRLLDASPRKSGCGCGCGGSGSCSKGYAAKVVKRAPSRLEKVDEAGYEFWGILSTDELDRQSDVVDQEGLDWSQYDRPGNNILVWNHEHGSFPIGTITSIHRVRKGNVTQTVGKIRFSRHNPQAKQARDQVIAGEIAGLSIGFEPSQTVPLRHGKNHYKRAVVLDVSLTPIAANGNCRICYSDGRPCD